MSHAQQMRRPSSFGYMCPQQRQMSSLSRVYHRNSSVHATSLPPSSCANFNLPHNHPVSDEFRRRLRTFRMDPLQKWRVKGLLPWKLVLQAVKIVAVTFQLVMFAKLVSQYFRHQDNTLALFKEIFMSETDFAADVVPYPPAFPAAVHTKEDFYAHVNKAFSVYSNIGNVSLGLIGYAERVSSRNPLSRIAFCKESYVHAVVDPSSHFYNFSSSIIHKCIHIPDPKTKTYFPDLKDFSVESYLEHQKFSIEFQSLMRVVVVFPLRTIYLNSADQEETPDCFDVNVTVTYDNSLRDGRMTIELSSSGRQRRCRGVVTGSPSQREASRKLVLNIVVLLICCLSLIFSLLSLYRGNRMRLLTLHYLKSNFGKKMHSSEHLFFFDSWLLITMATDCLTICGTVIKLRLEKRIFESVYFSSCSVLLGLGGLFAWISMLRYLSFFPMYNVLLLTVKRSLPYLLRFSICIILLFCGFAFCGWLVLSPYHVKFRSLSTTSECLFSLVNGDDMFMTFAGLNPRGDLLIWWFNRIYVYVFVSLFIYLVLSLFIAIIMESFDVVQICYTDGFPRSDLQVRQAFDSLTTSSFLTLTQQFMDSCPLDAPDESDVQSDQTPMKKFKERISAFCSRLKWK